MKFIHVNGSWIPEHMTSYRTKFNVYKVIVTINIYLHEDYVIKVIGIGSIIIEVLVKRKTQKNCIKDVLHVPKLQTNLFFVSNFLYNGLKLQFNLKKTL